MTRRDSAWLLLGCAAATAYASLFPFTLTPFVGLRTAWSSLGPVWPPLSLRDFAANVLLFVPVGYFMAGATAPAADTRRARTLGAAATVIGALVLSLSLEVAQAGRTDRVAAWSDVLAHVVGGLCGLAGWHASLPVMSWLARRLPSRPIAGRLAIPAAAGWAGIVVAYHWLPFDFTLDTQAAAQKIAGTSLLPFAAYYGGPSLIAMMTLFRKAFLSAVLGVLMVEARSTAGSPTRGRPWTSLAVACLFFSAIEAGQVLLPGRVPDLGDVVVGAASAMAGGLAWLRMRSVSRPDA